MIEASRKAAQNTVDKVTHRLENPLNESLVVCHIDDEVGYGVFTTETIECGEIICLYSGLFELKDPSLLEEPYVPSEPKRFGYVLGGKKRVLSKIFQEAEPAFFGPSYAARL